MHGLQWDYSFPRSPHGERDQVSHPYIARRYYVPYHTVPFVPLSAANLLGNFSVVLTYDLFITLGLITAVPVSAGKVISLLCKT
jgi:hypothetical protein